MSAISPDGKSGGVADTSVPNFVYRWTERDVKKPFPAMTQLVSPRSSFFMICEFPSKGLRGTAAESCDR